MRITGVEAIPIEVPLRPSSEPGGLAPYVGNDESIESVRRMLVRIETDGGVVGWGELWPDAALSVPATKATIETDVAERVVGTPVWNVEPLAEAFAREYFDARSFVGAVEVAMWDAHGKHLGVPLYQLLGGRCRETVPVAYLMGILDADRSREHARWATEQGFEVLKTKGGNDWRSDVDRLVAIHDAVGGGVDLRLDPNQGWAFGEAVRVAARLERRGVDLQYLEQPIRTDAATELARLRSRVRSPIAANEDTYRPGGLRRLCEAGAVDAAVVDLVPSGGISGVRRLAAVAAEYGVSLAHHNAFDLGIKTAAILHTVAATPAFDLAADTVYYAIGDDVVAEPFDPAGGSMAVPEGPGLGVQVDEDRVEALRIDA